MPFIRRGSVDILPAYFTAPISPSAINQVRADFALGAHERWDAALVKLKMHDNRTDLYGKSPEQVMQTLEADENRSGPGPGPFIIIDQDTKTNASVWYCERWAGKDDLWAEGESRLEEGMKRLPYLLRVRMTTISTPLMHLNLDIANISIPEMPEAYRGDPSEPYQIQHDDTDWENEKPPVAYVYAFPGEYEVSSAPEDVAGWLPKPKSVIRLREESARELNLMQSWAIGWESPEDGEGAMSFTADRVWKSNDPSSTNEPVRWKRPPHKESPK